MGRACKASLCQILCLMEVVHIVVVKYESYLEENTSAKAAALGEYLSIDQGSCLRKQHGPGQLPCGITSVRQLHLKDTTGQDSWERSSAAALCLVEQLQSAIEKQHSSLWNDFNLLLKNSIHPCGTTSICY